MRRDRDDVYFIEDCVHRLNIFLKGSEDRGRISENIDAFRRGNSQDRRHSCGKDEGCAVDTLITERQPSLFTQQFKGKAHLMVDNNTRSCAEATTGSKSHGCGANENVNL